MKPDRLQGDPMTSRLFAIVLIMCFTLGWSATYHISPNGNDSNPGSSAKPWATIRKANQIVKPGDEAILHAGTYPDQIRPVNSGTADNSRIVFKAAGDGNVILTSLGTNSNDPGAGAIALGGRRYVTVDGTHRQFIRVQPGNKAYTALANFMGATGCIISGVHFDGSRQQTGGNNIVLFNYLYDKRPPAMCKHNVLRNCHLVGRVTSKNLRTEDLIHVAGNTRFNLIEDCYMEDTWHVVLNMGRIPGRQGALPFGNVIRNNTIKNRVHTALSIYNGGSNNNLIENNHLSASADATSPGPGPGNALQLSTAGAIIRYNLITKGGAKDNDISSIGGMAMSVGGEGSPGAFNNRVYNNTFTKNRGPSVGVFGFSGASPNTIGKGVFVNNIIHGTNWLRNRLITYWDGNHSTNDKYFCNVFGTPGKTADTPLIECKEGLKSFNAAQSSWSNPRPEFKNLYGFPNRYDANPGFKDYNGNDYTLKANSAQTDAGAPLTRIHGSDNGTGTRLMVEDARFFFAEASSFPAWMNVQNDWIAIGRTMDAASKVQVVGVNDTTNTITLAKVVARKDGDYVWLWKDSDGTQVIVGKAPDIGAFEYGQSTKMVPAPATNLESGLNIRVVPRGLSLGVFEIGLEGIGVTHGKVSIFNSLGRRVFSLPGNDAAWTWDSRAVAPGIYAILGVVGAQSASKRITVIR